MLVFAIRGVFRGTIRQVFAFIGVVGGLWVAAWVSRWVAAHWIGARPAIVFLALRWLVAALGGLAVASLFAWLGEVLGAAVGKSPVHWLDRVTGFAVGASLGAVITAFVLLVALIVPWRAAGQVVASARISPPVLNGAAYACDLGVRYFPGSDWLRSRFHAAAKQVRAGGRPS